MEVMEIFKSKKCAAWLYGGRMVMPWACAEPEKLEQCGKPACETIAVALGFAQMWVCPEHYEQSTGLASRTVESILENGPYSSA
jgi:hypothetical protein